MSDPVNHPSHYSGNIECIDAIREQLDPEGFVAYCHGNIVKYLWRWRSKGGVQDLRKAQVYLEWMVEEAQKHEEGLQLQYGPWSKGNDTLLQRVQVDSLDGKELEVSHVSVGEAEAELQEAQEDKLPLLWSENTGVYGFCVPECGYTIEFWDCEEETYSQYLKAEGGRDG